jgi:hypothetical protein
VKAEFLGKAILNVPRDLSQVCVITAKYHVSALNIGDDILESQGFMQFFEFIHPYRLVTANIDAAKQ